MIGSLMNSIPVKLIGDVKLSYLLFAPAAIGIALPIYFLSKVMGQKYKLTNSALQVWSNIGARRFADVPLQDIEEIEIESNSGLEFYNSGDLVLRNSKGAVIERIRGVVRPDVFRQNILKTRDARKHVASSMARIEARQTA